MPTNKLFEAIVAELAESSDDPRERAVRAHDLVRSRVLFGFTPYFERVSPEQTLRLGRGHCNPKGHLFVTLLRRLGIEARLHFVSIAPAILDGCSGARMPAELNHAYSEVRLDDRWVRVDSYIVDPALRDAGLRRLEQEYREVGYGVHADAVREWDGASDSFCQFCADQMALKDHGVFDDPRDFYATPAYAHRLGPVQMNHALALYRLYPRHVWERKLNHRIDALRAKERPRGGSIPEEPPEARRPT